MVIVNSVNVLPDSSVHCVTPAGAPTVIQCHCRPVYQILLASCTAPAASRFAFNINRCPIAGELLQQQDGGLGQFQCIGRKGEPRHVDVTMQRS